MEQSQRHPLLLPRSDDARKPTCPHVAIRKYSCFNCRSCICYLRLSDNVHLPSMPGTICHRTPSSCASMSSYMSRSFCSVASSAFHMPRPDASSMRFSTFANACAALHVSYFCSSGVSGPHNFCCARCVCCSTDQLGWNSWQSRFLTAAPRVTDRRLPGRGACPCASQVFLFLIILASQSVLGHSQCKP